MADRETDDVLGMRACLCRVRKDPLLSLPLYQQAICVRFLFPGQLWR